jgi:phage gp29-like protein
MSRPRNLERHFATWEASIEDGTVWGFLPDIDPILYKTGQDVTVFEQLLADPHVFACFQSRKAGILTSEWKIEFPDKSEKQLGWYEKMLDALPMDDIISSLLNAPFYGFSANEITWKLIDGLWTPLAITEKPNEWFVFDKEGRCRFLSKEHQMEGQLLPPYKFLVTRNFPNYKRPYGIRVLSRCYWPVVFKKSGYKYWAMAMEKYGIPWLVGKTPRSTDEARRKELLAGLEAMTQTATAVINDDESIEALDVWAKSKQENIFDQMINSANGEISKAILTQTLTTEVGEKGAYAASQSHLSIREDVCAMDKKLVAGAINVLFWFVNKLNFGAPKPPYLRFVEEEDAKKDHASRDSELVSQGVRFKPKYYMRQYHLRSDEFTVEKPVAQVANEKPEREHSKERKVAGQGEKAKNK